MEFPSFQTPDIMSKMSLLSEINKQKGRLKETNTVVKTVDGQRFVEKLTIETYERKKCLPSAFGFVVDTKPDDIPVMLVDNLYIGSQDCVMSHVLEKYNIQHILSIGIDIEVQNVVHKYVPCLDLPETDIGPVLDEGLPFLVNAKKLKQNVLVHCNAGVSRASMVAIGYLIKCEGMSYEDSYDLTKMKRPAIQPNVGFRRQLKELSGK